MCSLITIINTCKHFFLIYPDFESNLKEVTKLNRDNAYASYSNKYQDHFTCSYSSKAAFIDNKFSKRGNSIFRREISVYIYIEKILGKVNYCKKAHKNT